MKVSIVRHGESLSNLAGTLSGSTDDAALTDLGRAQALETGKNVKASERGIDVVLSSPLIRAYETAQIVAREIEYNGEIEKVDLAIERNFGSASGKPKAEAFAMLDNGTAIGAETVQEFGERIQRLIDLLKKRKEQHILLVCHAAVAQMFGAILTDVDPKDFLNYQSLGNAEIADFEI